MRKLNVWWETNKGFVGLICLIFTVIGVTVAILKYLGSDELYTEDNVKEIEQITKNIDLVNGTWYLVRNDSKNKIKMLTVWVGSYSSSNNIISGKLTKASNSKGGIKDISGIVSGINRAGFLSLSYGSTKQAGTGVGSWLFKHRRDQNNTFVGQAFGYDCDEEKLTMCPALFTTDVNYAKERYENDLSQPCIPIPLTKKQADELNFNLKVKSDSKCPKK